MVYDGDTYARDVVKDLSKEIGGKSILVTGASPGGLGAHFLEAVARSDPPPKELIVAVRSRSKGEEEVKVLKGINDKIITSVLELDLASFASVRKAAKEILDNHPEPIDVLVNNAGVMAVPYSKTEDGHEMQLQANHLGHFLFTSLLKDKILASKNGGRVVNVSSNGYRLSNVRYHDYDFHDGESYNRWLAYGQSKTAQLLFSKALAAKYGSRGLQSYAVHPGVIMNTSLGAHLQMEEFGELSLDLTAKYDKLLGNREGWDGFKMVEPDQGVATQVVAAFSPDLAKDNGAYMHYSVVCPEDDVYPWALGEIETRKTWELSEKLIGQKF